MSTTPFSDSLPGDVHAADRGPTGMGGAATPPEGWVPVDQRCHGLDRSSFRLALPVLVLAVLLVLVVPNVDAAVPGGTEVTAGQRVGLSGDVSFSPAAGWTLSSGLLLGSAPRSGGYPSSAEVVDGAVAFSVMTTSWTGTPEQLLGQFQSTTDANGDRRALHVSGNPQPFTTAAGQSGVLSSYRSTTTDGLAAALVLDGTGVLAIETGPTDGVSTPSSDVTAMLTSITGIEEQR